jgi:hypothetical protein
MKKLFSKLMMMALAAITFTACEDVPEPYDIPGTGTNVPSGQTEIEGGTGSGTLADPFNAAAALNFGSKLASGETSENYMYVKGKVVSVKEEFTTQYGNGTFYISTDGSAVNQFYAYRVNYLGNKKFASGDPQIQVGDEVIVCGKITNYNGTIETAQKEAFLYELNGVNRGGEPESGSSDTGTPTGDGTLQNPFNYAGVIAYCKQVGDTESPKDVYIKGKVASISDQYNTQYGNATFTISDDGSATGAFTVYRALYLGNKKYTSGDVLKEKDEVIVCGKVTNYKGNTPETVQGKAYLYSLNGKTGDEGTDPSADPTTPGEAKGSGTLQDPYNAQGAINFISSLEADKATAEVIYIKAKVSTIKNNYVADNYGNATFYISDDGTASNEFYCYRTLYLGNTKYTTGAVLKQGDEVVICGKVVNYRGNTPETVQNEAYLYSLNGSTEVTEGGDPDPNPNPDPVPTGDNLIVNGGFESWTGDVPDNWTTSSSAGNATLAKSTDARSGSFSVSVGFNASQNKRMGYKEINLKAGTYTFTFYAKSTTAEKSQTQAGYVDVVDGKAGSYKYGGYVSLTNTAWTEVSTTFTLTATTTVSLVMMNPKTSNYATAQDILVDDAKLSTADGGIE